MKFVDSDSIEITLTNQEINTYIMYYYLNIIEMSAHKGANSYKSKIQHNV